MTDEEYDKLTRQISDLKRYKQVAQSLASELEKTVEKGRDDTVSVNAGALSRLLLVINNN